ncbi:PWWP domain-containing protein 6 [Raphanus sativus]|uniref:PWWP domain-containing protein 6 n=1 Tax=Raphanus sativus TaxID=3726 RepID=A0A9W3DIA8_RAPSA|nr:PWWP domain-containing protein 6 [Raphanus sativus]XP_056863553.1 PWWP domain-containing protein 6 [Raphanus sativus]XP_056863554.1 PWWP domain-containing protein 6 [Raphanus sativus]
MGNFLTTGSRVSENREETDSNGSSSSSEEKSKASDVNMESVNDSGPVQDHAMSEEASSSLNTKQDHYSRDEFYVGDFVWVQGANRHQWWPGKLYDSSDASDLAFKQMRKDTTLLVAFCWKETFAWCTPSQLKPFVENFREFSKTSESTSFRSAVREAVREIGQHVENLLVCDEALVTPPVAVNCGVKKGVLVPDVRREIVKSLVLEKTGIVLEDVRSLAKEASFSDSLEVEVLKRKISAFYRSKGRFDLAKYDDDNPYIIGLEDKEDALKFNNSSCKRSLRKCSVFASKKRKHGDEEIERKEESGISIVVDLSTPMTSLCKRVKVDDVSSSVERNNGSGETIVQRGKRERKKSKYLSPEYVTDFSWRRRKSKTESESAEKKSYAEKAISSTTTEEILELIRAAALSTQYSKECKSSYDMIRGFVSIYRSFTYDYGAHKRNVSDEYNKQLEMKMDKSEVEKQFSGVDLYIKSGFGSTLPSKDDLIRTYTEFGDLDRERSCTLDNDSCARVSFLNVSEGEEAFYKSVEKCPFDTTSATVTFELKYPPSSGNGKGVMEMEWLKNKLEEMRALLDESEGGEVTEELKMRLEEESRNLLDKVKKMTVGSSS